MPPADSSSSVSLAASGLRECRPHKVVNLLRHRDVKERIAGRPSPRKGHVGWGGAVEPYASRFAPCVAAPATAARVLGGGDSDPGARHRHNDGGFYDRGRRAASTLALS